jgi:DNA (cytosine-5)-methyltransferase 1
MPKTIFSFFSGAGLLDLGFENANYNIAFVNEFNSQFLQAYQYARRNRNFIPQYGYHQCDIRNFLTGESNITLHQQINDEHEHGNLVGFIGGPPCPDFSVGGKNKGRNGENGVLAKSYVDLIIDCVPDFFVFENVKGLVKTAKHREYYEELKAALCDAGYYICDKTLNALNFGVPQDRERIILIGIRNNIPHINAWLDENNNIDFPWLNNAVFDNINEIKNLVWIGQQEFTENNIRHWPRRLPEQYKELAVETWFRRNDVIHHPNGNDVFRVKAGLNKMQTIAEGDVSRKSFKRLHRWRYSPTAAYGNNEVHLHPYKIRRLSVAETMAIQSLPAWFSLPPTMTLSNKFKVIGNGVPYLMAESIATTLREILDELQEENQ